MRGAGLRLPHAFYHGVGSTADVPGRFDCSIDGRAFMFDTNHATFRQARQTIALIRNQADTSTEPGESTINPESLWPRDQSSWHLGAGQEYLDAKESNRARFWKSLGVDCWTRGKLSLLPATSTVASSENTGLCAVATDSYVYLADGQTLKFSAPPYEDFDDNDADIQVSEDAQNIESICTDGHNVYAALGENGIHITESGASSSTHLNDLEATLISYVGDRLMAAKANSIYNITDPDSVDEPDSVFDHPNSNWTWTAFGAGPTAIYAAGYAGSHSAIYRMSVKDDGSGLDVAFVAGEVPFGERVYSICGYLGFVAVGTEDGYRLAITDGNGNLTFGARSRTGSPVRAFSPEDRFMWFTYENFDEFRTGLGRIDLSVFTDALVPAYASDLMAGTEGGTYSDYYSEFYDGPVQGSVTSICTGPDGKRLFTVDGVGLIAESEITVSEGWIDSGKISFGIPDPKIALRVAVTHDPLPVSSSIRVDVAGSNGSFVTAGTSSIPGSTRPSPIRVPEMSSVLYNVRLTLSGSVVLQGYDFRAYPVSERGVVINAPLLLREQVVTRGEEKFYNPGDELRWLESQISNTRLHSYKERGASYVVFLDSISFERDGATEDGQAYNGTAVCQMKALVAA